MDAVEAPRRIEGEGTGEHRWQTWLAATPWPDVSQGVALEPAQRLVVVAPHPDDEVLACGALVATHAARGAEVVIVAVTDGEGSHAGVSTHDPGVLAAQRRAERLRGLARLGLLQPDVRSLALGDGQVQGDALLAALRPILRAGDVVVSTWERDGHPDHEATGHATRQACERAGARWLAAPVWMWHWAVPGDARVPWHRLHRFSANPSACWRKQAALAAHVTQRTPRSAQLGAVLGTEVLARAAWRHEYFFI